jgi:hypothetical protein
MSMVAAVSATMFVSATNNHSLLRACSALL